MRLRRSSISPYRRHPALAAVALVALAPMMPIAAAGDEAVDPDTADDGVAAPDDGAVTDTGEAEPLEPQGLDEHEPDEQGLDEQGLDEEGLDEQGLEADDATEAADESGEIPDDADSALEMVRADSAPSLSGETASCDVPDGESETEALSGESSPTTDPATDPTCEVGGGDDGAMSEAGQPESESEAEQPEPEEPVVPGAEEPVVPGAEEPAEPVVPGVEEPVVPGVEEPVPGANEPELPVVEVPTVEEPVAEAPAAPTVQVAEAGETADRKTNKKAGAGADATVEVSDAVDAGVIGDGDADDDVENAPNFGDAGLRAERYDGVYAQGVPVWVAMTATRFLESRGNYSAQAPGSTASGAYQVIDSTWNGYGGYRRSVDAPAAVQDQFAYESMVAILKRYGNDVSAIPLAWYYPAALRNPDLMDVVPVPEAGNVLTPRQYQARWMSIFHQHLEAGSPVFLPADTDALIPAIAFPVLGPTKFWDDWHADRDGGARRHEGLDFMGENGQPLRAAFDGVVTRIRPDNVGRPGVGITITRADGIRANYFHLDSQFKWHPDLDVGDTVKAGQIIAFLGDTGNAGIPHLHFELRTEDGEPIAPYPAALEAIQREQCSVGIGPWSTEFQSPAEIAANLAEAAAEAAARVADLALAELGEANVIEEVDEPTVHQISGPDGARWTVSSDGAVTARGVGALVAPGQGACDQIPELEFGTGAAGLGIELLPEDWWGEDVDPDDLAAMIAAVEAERSHEFDGSDRDPTSTVLRIRIGRAGILSALSEPDVFAYAGLDQLAE